MKHSTDMYDDEEIRCRKLGHSLTFRYCRMEGVDEPCGKIIDCWISRVRILDYLNQQFGTNFLREFANRPKKDRLSLILEVLDREKRREKKNGE